MKRKIQKNQYKLLCKMLLGGLTLFGSFQHAFALPVEPTVPDRQHISDVVINTDKTIMNITGTGNAFIRWNDFSINPNELVRFSGMNNMLNYVSLPNPSLIYGSIDAANVKNNFYIINPSGILFGPDSTVLANNFYVSTRSLSENDISKYINGTNPLDSAIDVSKINNGGLKSSDILGAYDIADGDVLFLGKVQANSITIEGNTIQIRNTKDFTDMDDNVLTGSAVNLISNNSPEVGYEITADDAKNFKLANPFYFNLTKINNEDSFIKDLADYYGIYLYKNNKGKIIDSTNNDNYKNNVTVSNSNYDALRNLYTFYKAQIDAATSYNDKVLVALAMDSAIKEKLGVSNLSIFNTSSAATTLVWSDSTSDSTYSDALTSVTNKFNDIYNSSDTSSKYKYFIADAIGDENMTNSANKLGWNAKSIYGGSQSISDFRLVQSATDLQNINFSYFSADNQLDPVEGKMHGNYMLANDISSVGTFTPLGYNMTFKDFYSSDQSINFNGLNFKIKGLTADDSFSDGKEEPFTSVGLFSIFSGSVKNLRLENFNVSSDKQKSAVGALIGTVAHNSLAAKDDFGWQWQDGTPQTTSIKNVLLTGTNEISVNNSYSEAGGLVGLVGAPIYNTMKDLSVAYETEYLVYNVPGAPNVIFNNVETFGDTSVVDFGGSTRTAAGGLLGGRILGAVTFNNSVNRATVYSDEAAGGLLGKAYNLLTYLDASDYSSIVVPTPKSTETFLSFNNSANFGAIESKFVAGGLLGQNDAYNTENENYDYKISFQNSFNGGTVKGYSSVGGIVGSLNAPMYIDVDQVFNYGSISGSTVGGLFGSLYMFDDDSDNATIKNSYNRGDVSAFGDDSFGGGLIGSWHGGSISNVYNTGDVKAVPYVWDDGDGNTSTLPSSPKLGGLIGLSNSADNKLSNSYNLGSVSGGVVNDGIAAVSSLGSFTNVNSTDDETFDASSIYKNWSIDFGGDSSNKIWRVYKNPSDTNDIDRQPLLSSFLFDADINRYFEISADDISSNNKINPADQISVADITSLSIHNSDGSIIDTRYKNSALSLSNNDVFTSFDILHSATDGIFDVTSKNYFADALLFSSQFGYNFHFYNNNSVWSPLNDSATNETLNAFISTALANPDHNSIFLKTPASSNSVNISILVNDATITDGIFSVLSNDDDSSFSISSNSDDDDSHAFISSLSSVLNVINSIGNEYEI